MGRAQSRHSVDHRFQALIGRMATGLAPRDDVFRESFKPS